MNKLLVGAFAALALVVGPVVAQQDNAGGGGGGLGGLSTGTMAGIGAGLLVVGGIVANGSGNAKLPPGGGNGVCPSGQILVNGECETIVVPDPDPVCEGQDPLVDGICTGTTTTVTVTASGSGTTTVTVPVTFTYLPTAG